MSLNIILNSTSKSDNNLNILRVFFSLNVLLYHCYALSNSESLKFLNNVLNPDLAVQGFFIISGFLIPQSYERAKSIKEFYEKRLRRLYPAYITIIILSALLGVFFSNFEFKQYFLSVQLYQYVAANAIFLNFLQQKLPGVFDNNLFSAVNGSLWTLKIEVAFYLIVPIIIFFKRKYKANILYPILILISLTYYLITIKIFKDSGNEFYLFLSRQLPGQLFFFLIGAWFIEFKDHQLTKKLLRIIGPLTVIMMFINVFAILKIILLPFFVFYLAFGLPGLKYPFYREDISYGLYIYHFPVIQIIVQLGFFHQQPFEALFWSLFITTFLAICSWKLIEKPVLYNGGRIRKTIG